MELNNTIIDLLEKNDFSVGEIEEQDGDFYVEVSFYSPAGEDFNATIWFDGSSEGFLDKFAEYARDFDVDEHIMLYANHLGENGVPATIEELLDDAKAIKSMLICMSDGLKAEKEGEALLPNEPELCTMMSLSTAHLRPETLCLLVAGEIDGVPSYRKPVPGADEESSTAHLRPETLCLLVAGEIDGVPSYRKPVPGADEESYGVFVCVGDADSEERNAFPADLAQIWDYAYQHNIWWVMFDRDAPMCSKFTNFSSEWQKEGNA